MCLGLSFPLSRNTEFALYLSSWRGLRLCPTVAHLMEVRFLYTLTSEGPQGESWLDWEFWK